MPIMEVELVSYNDYKGMVHKESIKRRDSEQLHGLNGDYHDAKGDGDLNKVLATVSKIRELRSDMGLGEDQVLSTDFHRYLTHKITSAEPGTTEQQHYSVLLIEDQQNH